LLRRLFRLGFVWVLAVVLAGCGGGGGGAGSNGTQKVDEGRSLLNGLIRDPSTQTTANLDKVVQTFQAAANADPNNMQAQFGLSLAIGARAAQRIDTVYGQYIPLNRSVHPANPGALLCGWKLPQALTATSLQYALGDSLKAVLNGNLLFIQSQTSRSIDPIQVENDLTKLADDLDTMVAALATIPNGAVVTFEIADPARPDNPTATIIFGQAELRLLEILAHAFRVPTNILLIYNLQPGNFDFNAALLDKFGARGIGDGTPFTITPSEYLPGGEFGKVKTDGKSRAAKAKQSLQRLLDQAGPTLDAIQSQLWYINQSPSALAEMKKAQDWITHVKSLNLLTTPTTIKAIKHPWALETTENALVDLGKALDNPPADLRALAPNVTFWITRSLNDDGTYNYNYAYVNVAVNSYTDRTFGGLFAAPGLTNAYLYPMPPDPNTPGFNMLSNYGVHPSTMKDLLPLVVPYPVGGQYQIDIQWPWK
jgi:hypothetical protein